MVIKILKASTSFAGINYNEKKNAKGVSELLCAKNFGFADKLQEQKKAFYTDYMMKVCATNPNVKNKQFHAVVTCQGKELDHKQLLEIAESYLKKMGYANNPYIIYGHKDTDNNHVHIVSTRVDKNGNKINDGYEQLRTQEFIRELSLQKEKKIDNVVDSVMGYKVGSIHQFKLLFEQLGYRTNEKDENTISIIKEGRVVTDIDKSKINIASNLNHARQKQIEAILYKYKQSYNTTINFIPTNLPGGLSSKNEGIYSSQLSDYLKNKHGIELVFHGKNGLNPYGYTIIDHLSKEVFKGGDVMKLQELLRNSTADLNINQVLNEQLDKKASFKELKVLFSTNGYHLENTGEVSKKSDNIVLQTIPKDILAQFKYQSRLKKALNFTITSSNDLKFLSRIFYVKEQDLSAIEKTKDHTDKQLLLKSEIQNSLANNYETPISEILNKHQAQVFSMNDELYMFSSNRNILLNINESFSAKEAIGLSNYVLKDYTPSKNKDKGKEVTNDEVKPINLDDIFNSLEDIINTMKDDTLPKKRKPQIDNNQQQNFNR